MFKKKIIGEIKQPYFFYKGRFDKINSKYFIKKIDEGCKSINNSSFKTNIIGEMTNYKFFNEDIEFLKLLWQIFDTVDEDIEMKEYKLYEAWGLKNGLSHYTKEHNHFGCLFSGVIYLNNHTQLLEFSEIKETIKPEAGGFVIFSSFLKHGCKRNIKNNNIKYGISFNCIPSEIYK
jgi:hypothetical protein